MDLGVSKENNFGRWGENREDLMKCDPLKDGCLINALIDEHCSLVADMMLGIEGSINRCETMLRRVPISYVGSPNLVAAMNFWTDRLKYYVDLSRSL